MKDKLTIEQSQRLIELGVDPSKASDFEEVDVTDLTDPNAFIETEYHRVFTLTDILSLFPKEIEEAGKFQLSITIFKGEWLVGYDENEKEKTALFDVEPLANLYFVSAPELIDALFELLVWTIEQKYIKL